MTLQTIATIHITPEHVMLNGKQLELAEATEATGKAMLTACYKQRVGNYPKYYKMDPLARLGFLAAELLLQSLDEEPVEEREDHAIVLVNRSASLAADRKYEQTIQTGDDYYPSPADFVYTLPNIVTGEIAIRHHYHGETTFAVIGHQDDHTLQLLIEQALMDKMTKSVLGGWLECESEDVFEAKLSLVVRE